MRRLATTLMLLPIVAAVVDRSNSPRLQTCLLLGVAYAASIGGIGTWYLASRQQDRFAVAVPMAAKPP